jgi:Flp pilus assembly pilin Flp
MVNILSRLWRDESGESSSASVILITTIIALGLVVGLATVRDQLVQELGDVGLALENINQSYSTPTSSFVDPGPFPADPPNAPPACISLSEAASPES